jgi:hypothetical protein
MGCRLLGSDPSAARNSFFANRLQNQVHSMVRRLILLEAWRIVLAGSRRIIDMQIHSVGIDLGKTTFHLVALGAAGKVLLRKKFTRKQLITFTANMQISLIAMEACAGLTSSAVPCESKAMM